MPNLINIHTSSTGEQVASKVIEIDAPTFKVWEALTKPELMKNWMVDSETEINILTDWTVGSPIIMRGKMHRIKFENKGKVLQFEPEKILRYSHLSSLSRLPDETNSYSIIEFRLTPIDDGTNLALTLSNFPTEAILKHLAFYWNVTLEILKRKIEEHE
jgi:uncharacterized protein YndB with AHSA1/START domain